MATARRTAQKPDNTVRDRFWMWGHVPDCHRQWVPRESRITPAAAARQLGLHNLIMVVFANRPEPSEFAVYQESFHALRRVVWSVMGDSSSTRNNAAADMIMRNIRVFIGFSSCLWLIKTRRTMPP